MFMIYWILLAIWVVGLPVAWNIVSKKMVKNTLPEKISATLLWPLTGLLYAVHWLHMKS